MTRRMIHSVIIMLLCIVSFMTATYAWFASQKTLKEDKLWAKTLAKYFYDGIGTEEDPYIITTAKHLYNLVWLQNKDYFKEEDGTPKNCFFKIGNDHVHITEIDMAGKLDKGTGTTGAIPPIGSVDNPFTGYFDGNGCVIKNLWVSSDPSDWKEMPEGFSSIPDYKDGVGFFGYIDRPTNDNTSKVYAGNFILENVEITTNVNNSVVGLAAGFVGGAMSNVGVNNGIVTIKGTNTVLSEHALIGKIDTDSVWKDLPGSSGGGDLVIAPSGLKENPGDSEAIYKEFEEVTEEKVMIPGAAMINETESSAYYYGSLSHHLPSPQPSESNVFLYNGQLSFSSNSSDSVRTVTAGSNDVVSLSGYRSSDEKLNDTIASFQNYLISSYRTNSSIYGIRMNNEPNVTETFINSWSVHPTNCIWFKPQSSGHCLIAFGLENMNSNGYVSIYRYKRSNETGAAYQIQELQLVFLVPGKGNKNNLKNGSIVSFDLYFSDEDVGDYEYVIGKSTSGTNPAYFFFLKLAGVDENGGEVDGLSSVLEKVEFVQDGFQTSQFNANDYKPGATDLSFSGTSTANTTLNFDERNDGMVHYNSSNSGVAIKENVSASPESIKDTGPYDPREDTTS